jgi:vacuolar-type H+-ATPase subunit C/Vma6
MSAFFRRGRLAVVNPSVYAYINARIHALIGSLLKDDFFARLLKAPSFEEALFSFQDTKYKFIATIYAQSGDLKLVEKALTIYLYDEILRLKRHSPEVLQPLASVLLDKMRIDAFKTALRLWFDHAFRQRGIADFSEYIPREILLAGITHDEVINAPNAQELVKRVTGTPYEVIVPGILDLNSSKTLLLAEVALTNAYYRDFLKTLELYSKEKSYLEEIIAEEIDTINLERMVRVIPLVTKEVDFSKFWLPGGKKIKVSDFETISKSKIKDSAYEELFRRLGIFAGEVKDRAMGDKSAVLSELKKFHEQQKQKL